MNIDSLVKREAPSNSDHDKNYTTALRNMYNLYKDKPLPELKRLQAAHRRQYASDMTHNSTAACMVLYELIAERVTE